MRGGRARARRRRARGQGARPASCASGAREDASAGRRTDHQEARQEKDKVHANQEDGAKDGPSAEGAAGQGEGGGARAVGGGAGSVDGAGVSEENARCVAVARPRTQESGGRGWRPQPARARELAGFAQLGDAASQAQMEPAGGGDTRLSLRLFLLPLHCRVPAPLHTCSPLVRSSFSVQKESATAGVDTPHVPRSFCSMNEIGRAVQQTSFSSAACMRAREVTEVEEAPLPRRSPLDRLHS